MKDTIKYRCLFTVSGGLAVFAFFLYAYPYHLYHKEQLLLFTYSSGQIAGYMDKPAVLSCLLGDFITQFFLYKGVGAVIVAWLMMALGWVTYAICRKWSKAGLAIVLAILVPAWETLRFCDIVYPVSGTISFIGGLSMFLLTDKLKGKWRFTIAGLCGTCISYWLFGYGMFAFILPVLLMLLTRKKNYVGAGGMLAGVIALPLMSARPYLLTPSQAYTYPATTWWNIPNFGNERLLGLDTEAYFGNWEKVSELTKTEQQAGMISVSYNLANAMQGKLPDKLMDYYQPAGLGLFMPINEESNYLSTQLAGEVWFQLGDMTLAEHAAILSMIFSPQHKSARAIQRLAEINLINKDEAAAKKYLYLLSQTLAYKQWAEERMPGKESEAVKKWLNEKRSLLPSSDTIRTSTTDIAKSLRHLLDANPQNRMALDYLLCFHLLMKDLSGFMKDFQKYDPGSPGRLYAEALLIQLYKERATGEDIKKTGISPDIIQAFNEYNHIHTQSKGNSAALDGKFRDTYWFYYHFVQFQ